MGEGGCSPDYFLNRMTTGEVSLYLRGMAKRHRAGWEQNRFLCRLVYKIATGSDMPGMDFPWDADSVEEDEDAEALDALRQRAEAEQRRRKELKKQEENGKSSQMDSDIQDGEREDRRGVDI